MLTHMSKGTQTALIILSLILTLASTGWRFWLGLSIYTPLSVNLILQIVGTKENDEQ